ncbi:TetR/AcrR family transcriptional regulator [Streptomyces sp. NPDC058867]|uniref:TetR/AcrR family transcriptional regulator n=1 Tax=unclassified Streptomyces TaxID=2593676 RepID=UPI00369B9F9F
MRKEQGGRQGSRSKGKILEAVGALLDEREPDQVTITDVVHRAAVTRPTFYAAFADLPTAFAEAAVARLSDALDGEAIVDVTPADRQGVMAAAIRRILTRLDQHPDFFAKVISGHGGHIVQARIIDFLAEELRTNTPVSTPLANGPLPAEVSSAAIAAGTVWTMLTWTAQNPRPPLETIAQQITDLIHHSVVSGLGATDPPSN